tara:strand:+ start:1344 stop:2045 length:702 start_codon:yes stop_codon:yes gene_type:complete
MALPKLATPTYELEIPSTKEKITYRPFLVKEEKILLMAMESDDEHQMFRAISDIIDNCTYEKLDVKKLPLFDLEYVFLNIRAKSIGEIINLKLLCEDDGETYADVNINVDDIKVDFQKEHESTIQLTEEISLTLDYPKYNSISEMDDSNTEAIFGLIKNSISQIIEGETIHERADFTSKDLDEFMDSLNTKQFQDIQEFFETMPKLRHEVKFKNPKTKKQNKVTLEGLNSFFV